MVVCDGFYVGVIQEQSLYYAYMAFPGSERASLRLLRTVSMVGRLTVKAMSLGDFDRNL